MILLYEKQQQKMYATLLRRKTRTDELIYQTMNIITAYVYYIYIYILCFTKIRCIKWFFKVVYKIIIKLYIIEAFFSVDKTSG